MNMILHNITNFTIKNGESELDDDPDLQASFAAELATVFEKFHDNWQKIYEEMEKLRERIINASQEPAYGLHRKKQMPFFRMFEREIFAEGRTAKAKDAAMVAEAPDSYGMRPEDRISHLVNLTQKAYLIVERELRLTSFWESIPARNKLKAELLKTMLAKEFLTLPGIVKNRAHIISRIMEIAEKNNDIILYAEGQAGLYISITAGTQNCCKYVGRQLFAGCCIHDGHGGTGIINKP
jgi:type I restriction enzyme R subunit